MFDENKITLKDGNEVTIKPYEGDRLAGDVIIDYGTHQDSGIFLGGGISGHVIIDDPIIDIPEPINPPMDEPQKPPILGNDGLGGYIIAPRETDNVIISLLEIKKIIDEVIKNHPEIENIEVLNEFYDLLKEKYKFNRNYMNDYNISNYEKVNDVKDVVNNNLEDIRNAVLNLQEELDKEESKGL